MAFYYSVMSTTLIVLGSPGNQVGKRLAIGQQHIILQRQMRSIRSLWGRVQQRLRGVTRSIHFRLPFTFLQAKGGDALWLTHFAGIVGQLLD